MGALEVLVQRKLEEKDMLSQLTEVPICVPGHLPWHHTLSQKEPLHLPHAHSCLRETVCSMVQGQENPPWL